MYDRNGQLPAPQLLTTETATASVSSFSSSPGNSRATSSPTPSSAAPYVRSGRPDCRSIFLSGRPDCRSIFLSGRPDCRSIFPSGRPDCRSIFPSGRPDCRSIFPKRVQACGGAPRVPHFRWTTCFDILPPAAAGQVWTAQQRPHDHSYADVPACPVTTCLSLYHHLLNSTSDAEGRR